jgi:coenzyme PQQ precursor peptide PqqA
MDESDLRVCKNLQLSALGPQMRVLAGGLTRPISPLGLLIWEECWVRITERSRQQALSDWGKNMQWTAPAFEEVCLNCEINSYISAKL